MSKLKELTTNILSIQIPQIYGFYNKYTKVDYIKHKRRKIDDYNYDTKKSKLVVYEYEHNNDNNFYYLFIYEAENGKFFQRRFTQFGEEPLQLITESKVLLHINKNKSLF